MTQDDAISDVIVGDHRRRFSRKNRIGNWNDRTKSIALNVRAKDDRRLRQTRRKGINRDIRSVGLTPFDLVNDMMTIERCGPWSVALFAFHQVQRSKMPDDMKKTSHVLDLDEPDPIGRHSERDKIILAFGSGDRL